MKPVIDGLIIDRMDQNQEIVNQHSNEAALQSVAFKAIVKQIYEQIRQSSSAPPPPTPQSFQGEPC